MKDRIIQELDKVIDNKEGIGHIISLDTNDFDVLQILINVKITERYPHIPGDTIHFVGFYRDNIIEGIYSSLIKNTIISPSTDEKIIIENDKEVLK